MLSIPKKILTTVLKRDNLKKIGRGDLQLIAQGRGMVFGHSCQRIFLRLGDQVVHNRFPEWGKGVVVEEKNSVMAGGICIVRIIFRDGKERSFINDLNDHNCCYYSGVRLYGQDTN